LVKREVKNNKQNKIPKTKAFTGFVLLKKLVSIDPFLYFCRVKIIQVMIANNIFRVIGDVFTNGLFAPFNALKDADNWWISNIPNFVFIAIFFVLLGYWMNESVKFKKEGTEDLPK
jgi:H+/Cl- antiporter ClcA